MSVLAEIAPVKALLICPPSHHTAPRLDLPQKANKREKRALSQGESNVLRAFGFPDLPRGQCEVYGSCRTCGKAYSRFSKLGAHIPTQHLGCQMKPNSQQVQIRRLEAAEELAVDEILSLSSQGYSPRLIASKLNSLGHHTRRIDSGSWSDTQVRNVLRRSPM
jgi:hypothetical protein